MQNNWRHQTLENLDKDICFSLGADNNSHLIKTCKFLLKKQLKDYTIEDLRIMIGQEIGLYFLMPLAIKKLRNNLFAEGDMYEGDLLKNVLEVETKFWDDNKNYWQELNELIKDRRKEIAKMNFDISIFDDCKHSL